MTVRLISDPGETTRKIEKIRLTLRFVWKFPCGKGGWPRYEYRIRLDSLLDGRTGPMPKIDVQGAEIDVLQGASSSVKGRWDSFIRKKPAECDRKIRSMPDPLTPRLPLIESSA